MEVYPGIEEKTLFKPLRRCMDKRIQTHFITGFEYSDESKVWFDIRIKPIPEGILILTVDITKQRESANTLRATEERYRKLIDSVQDVVFTADPGGHFSYISGIIERYGYAPHEMIGELFERFVYPDDMLLLKRSFAETAAGKISTCDFRLLDRIGDVYHMRFTGRPLSGGSSTAEIIGVLTDLTEQHRKEEQLKQTQKMEAIGQMACGVAHDFNNILCVILGYSELVFDLTKEDKHLQVMLSKIQKAGKKASTLTRQLLAFSSNRAVQPEMINPNEVIRDSTDMLGRLIGENIELVTRLAEEVWYVKTNPGQIEQIIINLAVNARDAMPEGGRLTIETRSVKLDEVNEDCLIPVSAGYYVLISVSDTGFGMSKAVQEQVFNPFFTTKKPESGTGLGLATIHHIVKQNAGTIEIDSKVNKGTTFRIYLPILKERVSECGYNPVIQRNGGAEKILVVEDDGSVRNMVKEILEEAGYVVYTASDAPEAETILAEHGNTIDLVVIDIVLPGKSGFDLVKKFRHLCPNSKILYMSGYTDETILQHSNNKKRAQFIAKPFSNTELIQKVREVLDKKDTV